MGMTTHEWPQLPLSKSTNDEHTHPQPLPTMTQNEYNHPQTTTANPLTTWGIHPNDPQTTTTHHTKWAWPPTNNMNCPPSRQIPSRPQMTTMMHKTTTHNPQKPNSDEEHPLQPPTNDNCPPRHVTCKCKNNKSKTHDGTWGGGG